MSSDESERSRWQELGSREPYWAVCTEERFRASSLSGQDREDFFASGEREVAATFDRIDRHVDRNFRPRLSLDYGCGVGRLLLPIAQRSGRAIGVDISDAMLAEARANAIRRRVDNVEFQRPEDALRVETPDLEFVHSYIVFQHVQPAAGIEITRALLRRLKPGGIGSLHYTFRRKASAVRRLSHRLRRQVPGVNAIVNALQRRPLTEPMIPVHEYDRHEVIGVLGENGCDVLHALDTDHAGLLGAMLIFRKSDRG